MSTARSLLTVFSASILSLLPGGTIAAEPAPARPVNIVLVGDSTVTDSAGWGLGFKQFLTVAAQCTNTAMGGRSSMSFLKEGRWEKALALQGDYYLIQFGHNNEPGKPGRSTDMPTFVADMTRYVDEARAAGARPILITPLVRRQFDKADDHKINSSLEPYAREVRKIAAAQGVPLIDLHARSQALCEQLGRKGCLAFSPLKTVDGKTVPDGTHLDAKGSVLFARLVVEELRKVAPELSAVLRAEPAAVAAAPLPKADAIVSADGSGTHTTIQAAVAAAPANGAKPFVILIKPGVYREHVLVPEDKPGLVFRGEETAATTVIALGTNVGTIGPDGKKLSTPDSATVLVRAANFTAENLTFQNTTTREEKVQALALYVTGDRAVFHRCRFLGWQDTLRADAPRGGTSRQYFADCYIEGHVDFIYAAGTAVFQRCHIHSLANGYLTAASTPQNAPFGYVFLDCRVTAAPEVTGTYLGRPWRPFAAVAFLRTELPEQIRSSGWHNWDKSENEQTARFAEYRSTGPGARPEARVKWARQLTDDEAKAYTVANVLRGSDGWNPEINP